MRSSNAMKWTGCAIGAFMLAVTASGQSNPPVPAGFVRMDADEIKTGTIFGDPSKPGMYVTRNRFAPGTGSRPHYHDQDRYVTVIRGTWYVSLGPDSDVYNPDKMTALKPGSFVVHPAFGHHYDGAKDEEAIVQIMGMGPVKTVQLEATTGGAGGGRGTATPGGQ
jgi:quercetin dioxygenase-like cupin family protein